MQMINELENILNKKEINLSNASKDHFLPLQKEKGKYFLGIVSSSEECILDLDVTHYMSFSKEQFYSLEPSKAPHNFVGDDTNVEVKWKEQVDMDNGAFKHILYIPNLISNLLSIYQITHHGDNVKNEFLPNPVLVKNLRIMIQ